MEYKKVGKCAYCGDPIYEHQEKITPDKETYHKGCYTIMLRESPYPPERE